MGFYIGYGTNDKQQTFAYGCKRKMPISKTFFATGVAKSLITKLDTNNT
ncbi:hypothetical protein LDG_8338 [Legionella drancourtii LLAP12]|uniref:Uncharacterized protein n=1 Tax=Legionella drancourtii LLAP12 TaxID=658187 RepID=G9ESK2_9GAMM|nr:hypothetical protein LDG_8338 [Legionella drancourtii LLAP12]